MEKSEELVNLSTRMERFISDDMVEMRHKIGNSFDLVELDILEVCDFLKTVCLHISLFYIGLCKARGGCLSLSLSLCLFVCLFVCVCCLLACILSLSLSLSLWGVRGIEVRGHSLSLQCMHFIERSLRMNSTEE